MASFHCLKRKIDCQAFLEICDKRIEDHTLEDGKILAFMALNKYLLGVTFAHEHCRARAFASVDEYDENEHKWACINMLIFSDETEAAE